MIKKGLVLSREKYDAVVFDLDGVVTRTAEVHAAGWKRLFDEYLRSREGESFEPFDVEGDYLTYVDGKPRYDGVRSFLESRGIDDLPFGDPDDPPGWETVCGLGNRKDGYFREALGGEGAKVYESTLRLVEGLKKAGIRTAVISSSRNCSAILESAGLTGLFEVRVDGVLAQELNLNGKPAPDVFLEAARRLGATPDRTVVVEDAISGVQAGRAGNFALVIGVDRAGQADALRENGADAVVGDLEEVVVAEEEGDLPDALDHIQAIVGQCDGRGLAVFLDYDGTLTPIVERPELAVLSEETQASIRRLASRCLVAVVSGRDLADVRDKVGVDEILYAGSHGFDITGPEGKNLEYQHGTDFLPVLDEAESELRGTLEADVPGVLVERKKFSIAIHYRQVRPGDEQRVEAAVDKMVAQRSELKKSGGKKIFELQPKIDWNKGKALQWILQALNLD
ncbi:MAG: trehalose-phosphatase, partial [Opitutales bacterium]